MDEREACLLLKRRFEAAGFTIEENRPLAVDGRQFEIDGFDAARQVGYEYLTSEAGDGWDVDADVIAALTAHRERGDLHVLVVDEADADAGALGKAADAFLAALPPPPKARAAKAKKPAKPPAEKPAKPRAKKR